MPSHQPKQNYGIETMGNLSESRGEAESRGSETDRKKNRDPSHGAMDSKPPQVPTVQSDSNQEKTVPAPLNRSAVVFLSSDKFGEGDPQLGKILIRAAIKTMAKLSPLPYRFIFINAGVTLCCEGSELLDDLTVLQNLGMELLCCGTCLDYYKLKEKIKVGRVSNMVEILNSLNAATSTIRL